MEVAISEHEWEEHKRDVVTILKVLQGDMTDPDNFPGMVNQVRRLEEAEEERRKKLENDLMSKRDTLRGMAVAAVPGLLALLGFIGLAILHFFGWKKP